MVRYIVSIKYFLTLYSVNKTLFIAREDLLRAREESARVQDDAQAQIPLAPGSRVLRAQRLTGAN